MKVSELIAQLEGADPDAEVLIAEQPTYPFENTIRGIAIRDEFTDEDDIPDGATPNDVFILEGRQLRYGTKKAWGNFGV